MMSTANANFTVENQNNRNFAEKLKSFQNLLLKDLQEQYDELLQKMPENFMLAWQKDDEAYLHTYCPSSAYVPIAAFKEIGFVDNEVNCAMKILRISYDSESDLAGTYHHFFIEDIDGFEYEYDIKKPNKLQQFVQESKKYVETIRDSLENLLSAKRNYEKFKENCIE